MAVLCCAGTDDEVRDLRQAVAEHHRDANVQPLRQEWKELMDLKSKKGLSDASEVRQKVCQRDAMLRRDSIAARCEHGQHEPSRVPIPSHPILGRCSQALLKRITELRNMGLDELLLMDYANVNWAKIRKSKVGPRS
jgi:hypothetical protein